MVDCIFGLWSVAADGMIVDVIVDVILGCMWMIGPEFGLLYSSSIRRYSAVDLFAWMKTCIYVWSVQTCQVDEMVLAVFWFHGDNCFLNLYHIFDGTDRDGDAVRTGHLVSGDNDRRHGNRRNRHHIGLDVVEIAPVHGLLISRDCNLWSC